MKKLSWIPLALFGTLLTSLLYFPGALNGDSKWQMAQAMSGHFNSHHPVIMAYVWRLFIRVIPGPGSIFLLHVILFWVGIAWLLEERLKTAGRRWACALLYVAYIPLSVTFFTILKDTGLAAAMVLATGAFVRFERTREPWVFGVALMALFYACQVRHDAILAVIPYSIWGGRLLAKAKWKMAALVIAFVVIVPWRVYEHLGMNPAKGRESQIPMLYDVVALSVAKNENFVPEFYSRGNPPLTMDDIRLLYNPNSSLPLFWPPPTFTRHIGWVSNDRDWATLAATWIMVIVTEPGAFAAHKARLFLRLMGFNHQDYWPYWVPSDDDFQSIDRWNKPAQMGITHWITRHHNWIIFRAWFYALLLILMATFAFRKTKQQREGLKYFLVSIFIFQFGIGCLAVDSDFRFSFWTLFGCLIFPLLARFQPQQEFFSGEPPSKAGQSPV